MNGGAYNRNRKSSSKQAIALRIKYVCHLLVFNKASKRHNKSNDNFITSQRGAYKYRMHFFVYR